MSHSIPEPQYGQPMTGEAPINVQQNINPVGETPAMAQPQMQQIPGAPIAQAPVENGYPGQAPVGIPQGAPIAQAPVMQEQAQVAIQTPAPLEPQSAPQAMSQTAVNAPAPMEAPVMQEQAPVQGMYQAPMQGQPQGAPEMQAPVAQQQVYSQPPVQGMPQQPQQPQQGYAPQGMAQQGMAPQGYAPQSAPMTQGIPQQGQYQAPVQGIPQQYGNPVQGMPQQGMPQQGYAPQGQPQYQQPVPGSSAPGYSNQPYMDMSAVGTQTPTGHPLKTKFTGKAILVSIKTMLNKKGNKMAMGMINPTPGVPNTPTFRFICFSSTSAKQADVVNDPNYAQYIQVKKAVGARIEFTGSWEENVYQGKTSLQLMMDEFTFEGDPNIKGYAENYVDPAPQNPMDMLNGGNVSGGMMPGQMPQQYGAPQGMPAQQQYGAPQGMPQQGMAPQYGAPQGMAPQYGAPQGMAPQGQPMPQQYGAPQGQPLGQAQYQQQIPGVPNLPNIPGM